MRSFVLLFGLLLSTTVISQEGLLSFRIEKFGKQQELWLTNKSFSTLTVTVEFTTLENCYCEDLKEFYVIEASSETKIAKLVQSETAYAWKWNYKYWWRLGSVYAPYSEDFVYQLPYKKGTIYKVIQGYNGTFSHYGEIAYSIDFNLPENTPVLAARGGKVVQAESSFSSGGVDEYYRDRVNLVRILHSDGTIGDYYHFKFGGISVKPGQQVAAGELIGYSGNTGYSSTPHLHFDVSKPLNGKVSETIPVKFRTSNSNSEELRQANNYTAP
jgi:murein DD-endopeptidase MepM/ murein hydrolase activator NlpD